MKTEEEVINVSYRVIHVSSSEISLIIGTVHHTITAIGSYQFQVGERVKIVELLSPLNDRRPLYCFRYITAIRPMMAMLGDENVM